MTTMNKELLPNPTDLLLRRYFYREKSQDSQTDYKTKIKQEAIFPIFENKSKNIIQESDITKFIGCCEMFKTFYSHEQNFEKTTRLSLETYDMCIMKIDQFGMSEENKNDLHHIRNILKDYTSNIAYIFNRKKKLENIFERFDYEDFKKSLYGSLLVFICAMIIISEPSRKIDPDILTHLIKKGIVFATDLNSYVDTIDILTNPEEFSTFSKSQSQM